MILKQVARAAALALLFARPVGALVPKPIVVLDPGHGGQDRGVQVGSLNEADYTLDLAKKVAEILKKSGLDARLTRDQDVALSSATRTATANSLRARALISLHINFSYNNQAKGLRVFVPGPGPVDESVAPLWEQSSRLQAGASRQLGQALATALGEAGGRSVQSLKLTLFRGLGVPAAQVELDYASQAEALKALLGTENKDRLAASLAQGILSFVRGSGTEANNAAP